MPSAIQAQILAAVVALSDDEKVDLWKSAGKRIRGTSYATPSDLFSETVDRLLSGERAWQASVGFIPFMKNSMRSVAGADRARLARAAEKQDALASHQAFALLLRLGGDDGEALAAIERQRRIAAASDAIDRARRQLASDAAALAVIAGWMAGLSPSEIMASGAIDRETYDRARKRAIRAAKKALGADGS